MRRLIVIFLFMTVAFVLMAGCGSIAEQERGGGVSNTSPVAVDDNFTVAYSTPTDINITGNDSDSDGTINSMLFVTQPSHGTVIFITIDTIRYTPDANFSGTDSFTYKVIDNDGAISNVATVYINVENEIANMPPVAVDDNFTVAYSTPTDINITGNDSDSDGTINSMLFVTQPSHGTVIFITIDTIRYTPDANFSGTDSFTYKVIDNDGAISNVATVYLLVQ